MGINELSLTGADADSFAIISTELFYIGASPDFETKNQYQVTVNVDDETVGDTPDATVNFTLAITDIPDSIDTLLDDNFYRFRTGEGTYMFVGNDEKQTIEESYPNFILEGLAFNVSLQNNDNLIAFNRFRNSDKPGAYLYAGEAESINVREMYPQFIEEGIAFYAFDSEAGVGTDIYRLNNNGSYIYVAEAEKDSILTNFADQFVLEGVAFETLIV